MISQAKLAGYAIISHKHTNWKGGVLMCIYKSGCNGKKVRTISKKSFDGLIVRLPQAFLL